MTDSNKNDFDAYFFSDESIKNPVTLAALLLLFERVHIDVLGYETLCAQGKGAISFLFPEIEETIDKIILEEEKVIKKQMPLINAGLLVPHRNGFLIDSDFSPELQARLRLNRTSRISGVMGRGVEQYKELVFRDIIATASMMKLSPTSVVIGDRLISSVTNYFGKEVKLFDNLNISSLAGYLAIHSIKMTVPTFVPDSTEEILEIRDKLKNHIVPFWSEMKRLSWELYKIQKSYKGLDITNDIHALYSSNIDPILFELRKKINMERNGIWSKFVYGTTNLVKVVSKSFNPIDFLADILKALLDVDTSFQKYNETGNNSYALLLELPKLLNKRHK